MRSQPDYEIRQLAYELWNDAGRPDGEALRFWLVAEQQILKMKREQEEALDRGLEDSLPASDPPSEVMRSEKK